MISKRKYPLPGYGLSLIDPRIQRSLDAKKPKPTGRTPLKSYLVYFYPTDRLNQLLPIEQGADAGGAGRRSVKYRARNLATADHTSDAMSRAGLLPA